MNKKVYKQPQIFYIPLQTESLLQTLSKTEIKDNTGGGTNGPEGGGNGGASELSKEHWGSIDSWDSWEYPPQSLYK